MQLSQSSRRPWLRLLLASLGLMLLAAACAPSTPVSPLATSAPPSAAPVANVPTVSAPAQPTGAGAGGRVGVDADGNFYRGDPNAPVKLVEYSDFQ